MMKYILSVCMLFLITLECSGQSQLRIINIYKPDNSTLEQNIYDQLVRKRKATDYEIPLDEQEMRRISKISSSNGFGEEYIEQKFNRIGYKINWLPISIKSQQIAGELYAEIGKEVEILASGAQSVSSNIKIIDENGNLFFSGTPKKALRKLRKY